MTGYDITKLQCVKRQPSGAIQAACPICRMAGSDKTGNHLSILPSGQFNCIVGSGEPGHNSQIRALLKNGVVGDIEYIDPEPKIVVDPVYPEGILGRLVKDHSYWLNRGIRREIIEMLEGGVSPIDEKNKLSNRYIIPIRGLTGQINGFSGRILTHSTFAPKYKHLFKSSRVCWPWHISGPHIIKTKRAVLNEGWSEWMALANGGIWNTLSLFGLNLSDVMIGQLIGAGVENIDIATNDDPDDGKMVNGRVQRKGKLRALDIKAKLDNFFNPDKVRIRHPQGFNDWGACVQGGEAGAAELARFKEEVG
jgi:hypothetical protein